MNYFTPPPTKSNPPALEQPGLSSLPVSSSSRGIDHRKRKPYHCTFAGCVKSYVKPESLSQHQRRHPRSFECRYPPCGGLFFALGDRTEHEALQHGRSRTLVCYLCKAKAYSAESRDNFRAHVRRMHTDAVVQDVMVRATHNLGPPNAAESEAGPCFDHVCYLCPFTARKKISLYRHIQLTHPESQSCMKVAMARVKAAAAERNRKQA